MGPPRGAVLDQRMAELAALRVPYVRATVVRARRPTSANPGDTAVVLEDGRIEGFVGGACAEATVRRFGLEALQSGDPVLVRISPDQVGEGDLVDGAVVVGNPCLSGGELEIFLDPRRPPPRVVVLGDTPIGRSLALLGQDLGYDIESLGADLGGVDGVDVRGAAAVVVASHGRDEEPLLVAALRQGVPYVALVASPKRAAAVLASLDVNPEQRAAVRSPAGFDIGAHTAGEVALSILAEVVASVQSRRSVAAEGPGEEMALAKKRDQPSIASAVSPAAGPAPATAVDPMCGMTVAAVDSSIHSDAGGVRHWFCAPGCKSAFEAEQVSLTTPST